MAWQSRVLIDDLSGGSPEAGYEMLSTAIAEGLAHFNCRHTWIDYIPGYTRPDFYDYDKTTPRETAKRYAVEHSSGIMSAA